ncbi:Crp/Fnr family transcriptional regulator [Cryomorphaceae bacterium 1068]|nr:Crp/Fnr family transcriptional regulator [Cryomorphaceae bacterium 1068]
MNDIHLPFHPELKKEVLMHSIEKEVPAGTELLRDGQYVKLIPLVLSGMLKVSSHFEERDLLLYYIRPAESCVMSFTCVIKDEVAFGTAVAEEDSKLLLMPADKVTKWALRYPEMNRLFLDQYSLRYTELIDTLHQYVFRNLDARLLSYLKKEVELKNENPLKISHREIASDLGTVREVISRLMRKLEKEGHIHQIGNSIQVH